MPTDPIEKEKRDAINAKRRLKRRGPEYAASQREYLARTRESRAAKRRENYCKNKESITMKRKAYVLENREAISEKSRKRRVENIEKYKEKRKAYYEKTREISIAKSKAYVEANSELVKEKRKTFYLQNRGKILLAQKKRYEVKKTEILQKQKEYSKRFRQERSAYWKDYNLKRRKTDHLFALQSLCRSRMGHAFRGKGFSKKGSSRELLGCSYLELQNYLSGLMEEGMTWENRGGRDGWQIDHIIPLAAAKTPEEMLKLCHFSNLQPLWSADNSRKGSKLPCGKDIRKRQQKLF